MKKKKLFYKQKTKEESLAKNSKELNIRHHAQNNSLKLQALLKTSSNYFRKDLEFLCVSL